MLNAPSELGAFTSKYFTGLCRKILVTLHAIKDGFNLHICSFLRQYYHHISGRWLFCYLRLCVNLSFYPSAGFGYFAMQYISFIFTISDDPPCMSITSKESSAFQYTPYPVLHSVL